MRKPGPVAAGVIGGGVLAALVAWPALTASSELQQRRAEAGRLAAQSKSMATPSAMLVGETRALMASNRAAAERQIARSLMAQAKAGGLLIEAVSRGKAPGEHLIAVRFRLSGAEKGVLAIVDAVESDRPVMRLSEWRIEALADGDVRLTATVVAPWRA